MLFTALDSKAVVQMPLCDLRILRKDPEATETHDLRSEWAETNPKGS